MTIDYQKAWAGLNERQQKYMLLIYEADQENEKEWNGRDWQSRPKKSAAEWRWLMYDDVNVYNPLRPKLLKAKLIDEGTGSTFEALERRGYIQTQYRKPLGYESNPLQESFLHVCITALGRKLVRANLGYIPPSKPKKGQLQYYHWAVMAVLYKAHVEERHVKRGTNTYDDVYLSWNGFLRLRDYSPEPLAIELQLQGGRYREYTAIITGAGIRHYEKNYTEYKELYPEVETTEPLGIAPPQFEILLPKEHDKQKKSLINEFRQYAGSYFPEDYFWKDEPEGFEQKYGITFWNIRGLLGKYSVLPPKYPQFIALCEFAKIDPGAYPAVLALYPLPGSGREKFAQTMIEISKEWFEGRYAYKPRELKQMGRWTWEQLRHGRPMSEALFLELCQWLELNPLEFPEMNSQRTSLK
jgi:hypothetical protein